MTSSPLSLREQIEQVPTEVWREARRKGGYSNHDLMLESSHRAAHLVLDAVEAKADYANWSSDPAQEIVNELRAQLTVSPSPKGAQNE